MELFTKVWGLDLPELVITVQGGKTNIGLHPQFQKVVRKSLFKVTETTGAWIFTDGTNKGETNSVVGILETFLILQLDKMNATL
jgi:hypothetical protein